MINPYGADYGSKEVGQTILIDYPLHMTKDLNENFLGLFIGMPGKGKTWAAVRLAEQLDQTFEINRVCVSYEEFMSVLEKLAQKYEDGIDVSGRVVIFDEFQRTAGARKFMSYVNQAINDVLHTFRYLNLIVLFTTPHLSFIDINSRAVMHFQVTMKKKLKHMGLSQGQLTFTEIKNDPWNPSDKLYHFAPRIFSREGELKVKHVYFEKPSKKMIVQVEKKINSFKHSVLTETIANNEMRKMEADAQPQKTKAEILIECAKEVIENKTRYYDPHRQKWDRGALLLDYPEISSRFTDFKKMIETLMIRAK